MSVHPDEEAAARQLGIRGSECADGSDVKGALKECDESKSSDPNQGNSLSPAIFSPQKQNHYPNQPDKSVLRAPWILDHKTGTFNPQIKDKSYMRINYVNNLQQLKEGVGIGVPSGKDNRYSKQPTPSFLGMPFSPTHKTGLSSTEKHISFTQANKNYAHNHQQLSKIIGRESPLERERPFLNKLELFLPEWPLSHIFQPGPSNLPIPSGAHVDENANYGHNYQQFMEGFGTEVPIERENNHANQSPSSAFHRPKYSRKSRVDHFFTINPHSFKNKEEKKLPPFLKVHQNLATKKSINSIIEAYPRIRDLEALAGVKHINLPKTRWMKDKQIFEAHKSFAEELITSDGFKNEIELFFRNLKIKFPTVDLILPLPLHKYSDSLNSISFCIGASWAQLCCISRLIPSFPFSSKKAKSSLILWDELFQFVLDDKETIPIFFVNFWPKSPESDKANMIRKVLRIKSNYESDIATNPNIATASAWVLSELWLEFHDKLLYDKYAIASKRSLKTRFKKIINKLLIESDRSVEEFNFPTS
ncbi:hypothetical protein O181_003832 [Austropuccinia psidii MF-1]|uniref:Uncharacterized protein n=1 Tax=Austropuccinia psidii MF-1 TaxID=1389203 RepID=A0A9Q3BFK7_9BASI|nr:hypothetical protein [Austropuccinia psidii MF-1]